MRILELLRKQVSKLIDCKVQIQTSNDEADIDTRYTILPKLENVNTGDDFDTVRYYFTFLWFKVLKHWLFRFVYQGRI